LKNPLSIKDLTVTLSDATICDARENNMKSNQGSGQKVDGSKRKLLTGVAAGTMLATMPEWQKPIVQQVLLPAHAQTSIALAIGFQATSTPTFTIVFPRIV